MKKLNTSSENQIEPTADPSRNLDRYIERGRESPALKGIDWDMLVWGFDADDTVALKTRAHRSYRRAYSHFGAGRLAFFLKACGHSQ